MAVDDRFDLAGGEEFLSKALDIGERRVGDLRDEFVGKKLEFADKGVTSVAGEEVGFCFGVAAKAAEDGLFHRVEAGRREGERAELFGDMGRVTDGGVAKA